MELGLNKMPWYGQILLFGILAGLAVFGFEYFYAADARVKLDGKAQELEQVRARVTRGQLIAAQLPQFQAQVADLESRLEVLKTQLPETRDVGEMLRRVQTLATQSNLVVRTFRPQPLKQKELHTEWPMLLEFDGTYHNLGLFFDRVSKVPRIINISDIGIKAQDPKTQAEQGTTIAASVIATAFVLVDKPPAGAARPAGAPPAAGAAPSGTASAPAPMGPAAAAINGAKTAAAASSAASAATR
jgi:type IV pilus assembly protein PilO